MEAMQSNAPQFSHHNKGFINYVFCRNWAFRNPAGTRLDSSLVNKQVASVERCFVSRMRYFYGVQLTFSGSLQAAEIIIGLKTKG